jgi:hypothetical protein
MMATQLTETDVTNGADQLTESYVRQWFVPFGTLVRRSGGTDEQIQALIAAGAAPGAIYALRADGRWWPITPGDDGREAPAGSTRWYAPASLYWLRRGLLAIRDGDSPAAAATRNQETFIDQFIEALESERLASGNYPEAFEGKDLNLATARTIGEAEWDDWRNGGYGVCLRSFTGASCVAKESLGKSIKAELAAPERTMSDFELLDLVERLASLMLPFAPFERPKCTPGLTVDRVIEHLMLGCEEPYGADR